MIPRVASYSIPIVDWQWQLDDFTFGAGTSFSTTEVRGLGSPPTRWAESPRALHHGSFGSQDTAAPRDLTFGLLVESIAARGDPPLYVMLNSLRRAFRPRSDNIPLAVQIPGWSQLVCLGRPRHCDYPVDRARQPRPNEWVEVTAQFTALDPILYSGAVQDAVIPQANAGTDAGMSFGVRTGSPNWPLGESFGVLTGTGAHPLGATFGSDTPGGGVGSGFYTAVNLGTESTAPVTTIYGPCDTPWIQLVETGQAIQIDIVLGSTDFLELDHDLHTVTLNGVSNRQAALDGSTSWWLLPPGSSTIHFRAVGAGLGASADVKWRHAWL